MCSTLRPRTRQLISHVSISQIFDWSARQITTNWLTQVVYQNGRLVVVGGQGTILTSVNGTDWVAQPGGTTEWLNAVDYAAGIWFIAGDGGTVLGSPDLTNWAVLREPD